MYIQGHARAEALRNFVLEDYIAVHTNPRDSGYRVVCGVRDREKGGVVNRVGLASTSETFSL